MKQLFFVNFPIGGKVYFMGSNKSIGMKSTTPMQIETKNISNMSVGLNHCIFVTCKHFFIFNSKLLIKFI